ncbi:hypothetical protein BMG523Draft_01176 [Frankia sp. BMG5.23]|nr:hypothetical protein BMG523Draft_01176 [Frankia sp. BMG5.23]
MVRRTVRLVTDNPTVLTEGLQKSYGGKRALVGLDLRVDAGTVHGVLGPNGAGKPATEAPDSSS